MCLFSKLITNKKYLPNKKNGGKPPPITDWRVMKVPTKCGRCEECRKQYARDWKVRINEEIKHDTRGMYVTLTFSNENIKELSELEETKELTGYTLDNAIATIAVRRFYERHRKKYGKTIKHWLITELGQRNTEHLHLHGIIWTDLSPIEIEGFWRYGGMYDGKYRAGHIKKSYINARSVNYITKYITKKDLKHKEYKSIVLASDRLGKRYIDTYNATLNKYKGEKTKETYTTRNGMEYALPMYYRNKVYSEEEKEKLWILKIDKGVRYLKGKEYNMNNEKDNKRYYKALRKAQIESSNRGYESKEDWEQKKYEEEQRKLRHKERGIIYDHREAGLEATATL